MTNLGNRTRKAQVLEFLQANKNEWVDGPELANERVGGSEGLRRLRELIEDGYPIESRRHPRAERDIWQYRLVVQTSVSPLRRVEDEIIYLKQQNPVVEENGVKQRLPEYKYDKPPRTIAFGTTVPCPRCRGRTQRYKFRKTDGLRHKDPSIEKTPCVGCNGWGIVPNIGPVA